CDTCGTGRVRQQRELGQARHRVHLQHRAGARRLDDDVDARHAGAPELAEGAGRCFRSRGPRGLRDPGRDDVVRFAGGVFGVVVVQGVLADDLERRQDLHLGRREHADRDLGPRGKPLDQHAAVVATGEDEPAGDSIDVLGDGQADGRSLTHRFDHERQAEPRHKALDAVGSYALLHLELFELGHVEPDRRQDLARARLVHAKGRGEHARTRVGQTEELQHSLHGAVLAETAVQGIENALEPAVAQDVPRAGVEIDGGDVVTAPEQRLGDLLAGTQRDLAFRGLASTKNRHLHFQRPTISTSGSIWMPNRRLTSAITRSMRRSTSEALAPPSLTMKLPCSVEMTAAPSRAPLSPAAWTRRPAESPGGFLKTLPQFLVLMGCVSLRSRVSFAISCLAWFPSPRSSCRVAETTKAPFNEPSRNADVRYPNCMSAGFHFFRPVPGTKPSTSTRTSR